MESSDKVYLLWDVKDSERLSMIHNPFNDSIELGELKITNGKSLITLRWTGPGANFFAHAEGYFETFNKRKQKKCEEAIDPDIRYFKKTLIVQKETAEFRSQFKNGSTPIDPANYRNNIEAEIEIDRFSNIIDISVHHTDRYARWKVFAKLKKVTLFN